MKAAREPVRRRVSFGNDHITVYPWKHPATGAARWRFAYRRDGAWKYKTYKTRVAAESAAYNILREIPAGLAWSALDTPARKFLEEVHRRTPEADRSAVLAFLRSRDTSAEIGAAVERFAAHKRSEAGETTPHLRQVGKILGHLAGHFAGTRVSEIHAPELAAWWQARGSGLAPKTRRDIRAHLVTFWRWCLRQGLAGSDPVTAAERLPGVKVSGGGKRVLSADELRAVLDGIAREYRAWVVLGAFAGLRPEEIAPARAKKLAKRGLRCEEIDWMFGVIRIPAEVSKVHRARIVPMCDALKAGLAWAGIEPGMTGRVCVRNPAPPGELARLGKLLFGGEWPQDALRHSYGSYRNAILRNLGQVAEEMGNSIPMLERHYHNPQPEQAGTEWFALRPNINTLNCSESDPMDRTFILQHSDGSDIQNLDLTTKTG